MNKQEIYRLLGEERIPHQVTEHIAVYNMEEMSAICIPHPEADAKNLFLRDDKKQNYYLITVKGDKRVDLKQFRRDNNTRPLGFASAEELMRFLGLNPGSVTPFGLLNDRECKVQFFLDEAFLEEPGLIGVHPNDNTATVLMKTEDLLRLIRKHGNEIRLISIGADET